jgi:hypothetical protein
MVNRTKGENEMTKVEDLKGRIEAHEKQAKWLGLEPDHERIAELRAMLAEATTEEIVGQIKEHYKNLWNL